MAFTTARLASLALLLAVVVVTLIVTDVEGTDVDVSRKKKDGANATKSPFFANAFPFF